MLDVPTVEPWFMADIPRTVDIGNTSALSAELCLPLIGKPGKLCKCKKIGRSPRGAPVCSMLSKNYSRNTFSADSVSNCLLYRSA